MNQKKSNPYYEACEQIKNAGIDALRDSVEVARYLLSRGLSSSTVKAFGVGAHEGKVLFPICVLGDGGFTVGGFQTRSIDGSEPKYKNTQNSMQFKKSYSLYGADVAEQHIALNKIVYVVEGVFDAMLMYQYGYPYTVAIMGSHMSDVQALFLRELSDNVCVVFDGDEAGRGGMSDACITLMSVGFEKPMGVVLPDGDDPATYLLKNGSLRLAPHVPLLEHWFNSGKSCGSVEGRYMFLRELVAAYSGLPKLKGFDDMVLRIMDEVRPL